MCFLVKSRNFSDDFIYPNVYFKIGPISRITFFDLGGHVVFCYEKLIHIHAARVHYSLFSEADTFSKIRRGLPGGGITCYVRL